MKKNSSIRNGFNTKPEIIFIDEIFLSYVHIASKKDCTLCGYQEDPKTRELIMCTWYCEIDTFQEILKNGGEQTGLLCELVNDSISQGEKDILIGIEEIIGDMLYIDNVVLGVDLCNMPGEKSDHDYFFIHEVFNKNDEAQIQEVYSIKMGHYLLFLNSSFDNYLYLIDKGINETEARKKANLKDDFMFEMAFLSNNIKNYTDK
jgi:hypothetical protein